ncbi:hypothetical protein KP509_06G000900 [Ceratopteris richardii]|nr:hypothetical protein KP509_06G000900 [Ceratopteris richardii]
MYANFGQLNDAFAVLMKSRSKSESTWNFLVCAYAAQGDQHKAFTLFVKMQSEKVPFSKPAVIRLLSLCCNKSDLYRGMEIHNLIRMGGYKIDVFVGTALVSMYGKCGSLDIAWKTFEEMSRRDAVSYSVMIGVLVRYEHNYDALQLLETMVKEGLKPDKITYVSALDACNSPCFLKEGRYLHQLAKQSGCGFDLVVGSALINMYGKCGSVEAARKVFEEMPEKNVVSWNSILSVYVRHNKGAEALKLLERMRHEDVKPDRITLVSAVDACTRHSLVAEGEMIHEVIQESQLHEDIILQNALLNMYGKCGNLHRAQTLFKDMRVKNVISWNTMIALHAQKDDIDEALQLLCRMQQEGGLADNATYACAFDACGSCFAYARGKMLHVGLIGANLEMDQFLRSALVNFYGKCGKLETARAVFSKMMERDVITWNTMLALLVNQGAGYEAHELFAQMQVEKVKPDKITFTCLLDACISLGLLSKGKKVHVILMNILDHFDAVLRTALVYMYGKCGDIRGAVRAFDEALAGDLIAWSAMIAMHAQHGQSTAAFSLFLRMQQKGIKPDDITFVSVLTACSYSGFFDEAFYYFTFMLEDCALLPTMEHFVSLIDLFGRAGCLIEAESLLCIIPSDTSAAHFLSLLGACRHHTDVERGERAARHVMEREYDFVSSYIALCNIYAAAYQGQLD